MSVSVSSEHRRRPRRTLRGRVSLLGTAVIGVWVVLVTALFNILLTQRLDHQGDVVLRAKAAAVAATVGTSGGGMVTIRDSGGDGQLDSGVWVYTQGKVVSRPPGGATDLDRFTARLAAGRPGAYSRGSDRLYVRPVLRHGRSVATVVALSSDVPYEKAEQEALFGSAAVALLMIGGAYPVLRLASERALRPVTDMATRAGEWSVSGLDERFDTHQAYREVQGLASTLNSVLDTLSAIVRHERQLSGELSHELRTPLTRILAETDLLTGRPQSADEAAAGHAAVRDAAIAMERILDTLLSTARATVRTAPGRSDVEEVLRSVVRRLPQHAATPGIDIDVEAGLAVGVDDTILERIVSPVLDNAVRYAERAVWLAAGHESGAVAVWVSDDGPGVPSHLRAAVFEPGMRGNPDDAHDGAGLGLALARRLAQAASGDIDMIGRATFRVRLPRA